MLHTVQYLHDRSTPKLRGTYTETKTEKDTTIYIYRVELNETSQLVVYMICRPIYLCHIY